MPVNFTDTEWATASVGGATLADAAQAISQMDEAAKTEWFPTYTYDTDGGALSNVVVTVKTKVTMPQWSGYANASQAEKDEWDRFYAALRAHEQGHLDLVNSQLSGIDQTLSGQTAADAKTAWKSALAALASASNDYDGSNDHGRNQGTVITLPP